MVSTRTTDGLHHLRHDGALLELRTRRGTWRTEVDVLRDGEPVATASGSEKAATPLPGPAAGPAPVVLVRFGLSGRIRRAELLLPPPHGLPAGADDARALAELPEPAAHLAGVRRHLFEPPAGSRAARVLAFGRRHPRLYASRHVAGAVAKVLLGLLGVTVLLRSLLRPAVEWVRERVPDVDLPLVPWPELPRIPWPDIPWPDLPEIPWPDLPDLHAPAWLLAVLATAKFWGPLLVALAVAVREVRRRRTAPPPGTTGSPPADPPADPPGARRAEEDRTARAHRRPRQAPPATPAHRRDGGGAVRREGGGGHVDG